MFSIRICRFNSRRRYVIPATRVLFGLLLCLWLIGSSSFGQTAGSKHPEKFTETITTEQGEKISFDMVLVPGGRFKIGSPAAEPGRKEHEGPQHEVILDAYYLAANETTLELFLAYYRETHTQEKDFYMPDAEPADVDAVTGPTPVYGDITMGRKITHPAIGMTWKNAMMFSKWLSTKTGKDYRLPTEAEWEYACREAGDSSYQTPSSPEELSEAVWFNSKTGTREVAAGKPNKLGLYDMLGNVEEWVYDFYSPEAYAQAAVHNPVSNPKGPETGRLHVARGGYYRSPVENLRCSARNFEQSWWRSGDPQLPKSQWWLPSMDHIGFRVALTAAD